MFKIIKFAVILFLFFCVIIINNNLWLLGLSNQDTFSWLIIGSIELLFFLGIMKLFFPRLMD